MTDVRLLRMELILARSTLARFGNPRAGDEGRGAWLAGLGAGGVTAGGVSTGAAPGGVPEVAAAGGVAAISGEALGTLSAILAGAGLEAAGFSFLSSTNSEDPKGSR